MQPYRQWVKPSGDIPMWVVTFDKDGANTAPETTAAMLDDIASGDYTDVHVFCHGWNNDFDKAVGRYEDFFGGYLAMAAAQQADVRPLLVGLSWPSTALVLPWEQAPDLAATDPDAEAELDALVDASDRGDHVRDLATRPSLGTAEVAELASLIASVLPGDDEVGASQQLTGDELLAAVGESKPRYDESGDFGTLDAATPADEPEAAVFGLGTVRKLVRLATVRLMKDRAGTVGGAGVAALLAEILASATPLHLIGHSYGTKVLLSGVAALRTPATVRSMLLLQPAISQLSFATDRGDRREGGYRACLERVERPLTLTFSKLDGALRRTYQWALRRPSDLGEVRAAAPGSSRFAALGGYGPAGCPPGGCAEIGMHEPGNPYFPGHAAVELLALDGSRGGIGGHGDISTEHTWWALHELVSGDR